MSLIHRLRPAGTGAAILCSACLPPATAAAGDNASAQLPPAAGAPVAVQRTVTLGLLPVTSSIDPALNPLRGAVEGMLDDGLPQLASVQIVDRNQIRKSFDDLVLAQQTRADLGVGGVVGAEVLLAASLVTEGGEVRLELSLIETATADVLEHVSRRVASAPALGKGAKEQLQAAAAEVQTAVDTFKAALPKRLAERAMRPAGVDVAVLPVRFEGNFGPDLVLTEGIRRHLADHIAANVPAARVLHRDLAEFVLNEAALADSGVVAQ